MDFNQMKNEMMDDVSDMFTQSDIEANKVFAALATIPILFWLPLVAAKESEFAKFYANQGLILLIFNVVLNVVSGILLLIPILGALIGGIISLVQIAAFLFLLISALQGKARYLPFIGKLFIAFK
jgi:uncharacterized membrane protein